MKYILESSVVDTNNFYLLDTFDSIDELLFHLKVSLTMENQMPKEARWDYRISIKED